MTLTSRSRSFFLTIWLNYFLAPQYSKFLSEWQKIVDIKNETEWPGTQFSGVLALSSHSLSVYLSATLLLYLSISKYAEMMFSVVRNWNSKFI